MNISIKEDKLIGLLFGASIRGPYTIDEINEIIAELPECHCNEKVNVNVPIEHNGNKFTISFKKGFIAKRTPCDWTISCPIYDCDKCPAYKVKDELTQVEAVKWWKEQYQ